MIDILLSTYNGERYLREQIDSILAQTYQDWQLIIRDDGSMDSTVDIVQEYIRSYKDRITLLEKNGNKGAMESFGELLQVSTSDYFMFCDQDDVWLPDKVEQTLNKMLQTEQTITKGCPVVVHTDLIVVDQDLNTINPSYFNYANIKPSLVNSDIDYLLIFNSVTGCTAMGNKAARKNACPIPPFAPMHDSWLAQSTLMAGGKIATLFSPTILYRQHSKNVIGAPSGKQSLNTRLAKNIKAFQYFCKYGSKPYLTQFLLHKIFFHLKR